MKNLKISLFTSLIFSTLYFFVSVISIPLLVKQFSVSLLDSTFKNLDRQSSILNLLYESTGDKNKFNTIAQNAISDSESENAFLSIINWTGNLVCFPNVTKIGERLDYDKTVDFGDSISGEVIYDSFFNYFNTLKNTDNYEIINLRPIKGSDLILVYHLNMSEISKTIIQVKTQAYSVFIILGLLLLILLLTIVRIVNNQSEKILDQKIINLEYNTQNLAKLNQSITNYQERLIKKEQESTVSPKLVPSEEIISEDISKQRILTYVRNELVTTLITDIAYIYVENTITYIISHEGRKTTSNDSLDKIYSMLKKELFFKANRQFVVAISAIEKITKYENSKLKIQVKPKSEIDIIIGKNKASAFKQWLDL